MSSAPLEGCTVPHFPRLLDPWPESWLLLAQVNCQCSSSGVCTDVASRMVLELGPGVPCWPGTHPFHTGSWGGCVLLGEGLRKMALLPANMS